MRWLNAGLLLASCAVVCQEGGQELVIPFQQAPPGFGQVAQDAAALQEGQRGTYRSILADEIAYLDGVFSLNESQKKRLETAIKGAVKRYEVSVRMPRLMLSDASGYPVYVRDNYRVLGMIRLECSSRWNRFGQRQSLRLWRRSRQRNSRPSRRLAWRIVDRRGSRRLCAGSMVAFGSPRTSGRSSSN